MNKNLEKFKGMGFSPVKKVKDGIVLKSDKGVVISYNDGNYEGFVKKSVNESLDEGKYSTGIALLTLISTLITYFTTDITIVSGESMSPTYSNHEVIIHTRSARDVSKLLVSRNCVVRFKNPEGETCIKRVVGLPGDVIEVEGRDLRINGKVIDDDNIDNLNKFRPQKAGERTHDYLKLVNEKHSMTLKPNQYFVMGDNKSNSVDSRSYGSIGISNIISIVQK